jgi:hypothetical protein
MVMRNLIRYDDTMCDRVLLTDVMLFALPMRCDACVVEEDANKVLRMMTPLHVTDDSRSGKSQKQNSDAIIPSICILLSYSCRFYTQRTGLFESWSFC